MKVATLVLDRGLSNTPVSPASVLTSAPSSCSSAAEADRQLSCDVLSWPLQDSM